VAVVEHAGVMIDGGYAVLLRLFVQLVVLVVHFCSLSMYIE